MKLQQLNAELEFIRNNELEIMSESFSSLISYFKNNKKSPFNAETRKEKIDYINELDALYKDAIEYSLGDNGLAVFVSGVISSFSSALKDKEEEYRVEIKISNEIKNAIKNIEIAADENIEKLLIKLGSVLSKLDHQVTKMVVAAINGVSTIISSLMGKGLPKEENSKYLQGGNKTGNRKDKSMSKFKDNPKFF